MALPMQENVNEMLGQLEDDDYKMVISYIRFLYSEKENRRATESGDHNQTKRVDQIVDSLVGILPDDGRNLEEYREERLRKYEVVD